MTDAQRALRARQAKQIRKIATDAIPPGKRLARKRDDENLDADAAARNEAFWRSAPDDEAPED